MYEDNGSTLIFDTANGEYWSFTYDIFNRLVKVSKSMAGTAGAQTVAEYTYDAENLRIRKSSVKNGDTWYVYGLNGEVLYEETAKDTTSYVYVNGRHFAMVETDTPTNTSATFFYSLDHLGSTVMATDATGKVVWQNEATPFGEWSGEVGVMHLKPKFTGKDADDEIGLTYYNARWMDPETGRFTSEDPAQDGGNWYAYCKSNPMRFTDPTGLHYEVGIGWEEDAKTPTPESGTSGGHQPEPTANPKQEQIIKDIDTRFKAQVTQGLKKGQGSIIVGLDGVGLFTMDEKLAKEYLNSGLPITEFIEKNDLVLWQGVTTDTIYPRMTDIASTQYNYSLGPNWEIAEFIMGAKGFVQLGKALVAKAIAAQTLKATIKNAGKAGFELTKELETIFGNQKWFQNWLRGNQSLTRISTPLNATEAQQLIDNAKNLNLSLEYNIKGLLGLEETGDWTGIAHFKIGNVHIPIAKGLENALKF